MGSLLTFAVKNLLENLRTWVLLRTQGRITDLPIYSIELPCQWLAAVTDIEKSAHCVQFFRRLPRPLGTTFHFHTYAPIIIFEFTYTLEFSQVSLSSVMHYSLTHTFLPLFSFRVQHPLLYTLSPSSDMYVLPAPSTSY
jgi:hypothetical protein